MSGPARNGLDEAKPAMEPMARPTVSIIVASAGVRAQLERCLAAVLPQAMDHEAEVVVVRRCSAEELKDLETTYPHVRFVAGGPRSSVSELRATGIAVASGDVIALLEDERIAPADWLDDRLDWFRSGELRASRQAVTAAHDWGAGSRRADNGAAGFRAEGNAREESHGDAARGRATAAGDRNLEHT